MNIHRSALKVGLAAITFLLTAAFSYADAIAYTCNPGAEICHGNLYSVNIFGLGGDIYQLDYGIKVMPAYDTYGDTGDFIYAIGIKNFTKETDGYSNPMLVAAPGGISNWALFNDELSNSGPCTENDKKGICIQAKSPSLGALLTIPDSDINAYYLIWSFTFQTDSKIANSAHIKYLYTDDAGKKLGSLGSWDIATQHVPPTPGPTPVPEPTSIVLFGIGLVGIGIVGRMRRK